jgi:hypothetical protein
MMRYPSILLAVRLRGRVIGRPGPHYGVVVFVVGDGDAVVDVVADGFDFDVELDEFLCGFFLFLLLGFGEIGFLF